MPTIIAVVIGLAVASGIYLHQNPDLELKSPKGIADQVADQRSPRERAPESFAVLAATNTPKPPTPVVPTSQPKTTSDFGILSEKIPRIFYEPKENRQAPRQAESAAQVAELERKVHTGINTERAKNGSSPKLRWDDRLGVVARSHSEDMTERGYFSHDTPEGLSPTDRIAKSGYGCWKGSHYGVAENIAIELKYKNLDKVAAAAVQSWMGSPGHRTNLLDGRYDRTGIGVSFGRWKGYDAVYLTQVFC
jgi:uncharacterized protein YkwD